MSSYFSDESEPEESKQSLFQLDISISNSGSILNCWKENLKLEGVEYLRKEANFLKKQYNLMLSANQIRIVAFCHVIGRQLETLLNQYATAYKKEEMSLIVQHDRKLKQLVHFLQVVEANNGTSYYNEAYEGKLSEIYSKLRKAMIYCLDLQAIFYIFFTISSFKDEETYEIYSSSFYAYQNYYDKEIKHILRGKPNLAPSFQQADSIKDLLVSLTFIISNQNINENTKIKYTALIKGQFFSKQKEKQLKETFIKESLRMYFCCYHSQIWREEEYESLCEMIIKEAFKNPSYIPYFFYIEPDEMRFSRRKKIKQFLTYFNQILDAIINLQHKKLTSNLISIQFMEAVLDEYQIEMLFHIIINFYNAIKNVYSLKDQQSRQLYIQGLEKIKKIYLSFETNVWICPTSVFVPLTNKFFSKNSDCLSQYVQKILPKFVENMCSEKLPNRIIVQNGQIIEERVSKLQYLSVFLSYVQDCTSKEETYIDFSDFVPVDLESAIMFVKTLGLKYNYHEPNEQEKNNYSLILKDCINYYKINQKFTWFKNEPNIDDRQIQFTLHREIKVSWARKIVQDVLNLRDERTNDLLITRNNNGEMNLETAIQALKYSFGMNISPNRYTIYDDSLFNLMKEMETILSLHYEDIFDLCIEDEININLLHLYLLIYNVRVERKLEIYPLVVTRIIQPWFTVHKKIGKQFKEKYYQFFKPFVISSYIPAVGETLLDHIMEFETVPDYKEGIIEKIDFFMEICEDQLPLNTDNAAEFLSRVISIFHPEMDVSIFLALVQVFLMFLKKISGLDEIFSLGSVLDHQLLLNKERLSQMISAMKSKDPLFVENFEKCLLGLIPQIYDEHKKEIDFESWGQLLRLAESSPSITVQFLMDVAKTKKQAQGPLIIIKALIAYALKKKNGSEADILQSREVWSLLEKQTGNIKLQKKQTFTKTFGFKLLEDLRADCKAQSQTEIYEVSVWKQFVWKAGNLQDILEFSDIPTLLLQPKENQKQFLISLILSKEYKNEILYKGTSKLPLLRECAIEVVKQLQKGEIKIRPEHVCKLIMINNKFASAEVEKFILDSISKFDGLIPIKIYQTYLVNQIKKELTDFSTESIKNHLYQKSDGNFDKINNIFKKIICLPISNFDSMNLKESMEHIEQNNEEWETESDHNHEIQDEENEEPIIQKQIQNKMPLHDALESSQNNEDEDEEFVGSEEYDDESMDEFDNDRPPIIEIFYEDEEENIGKYKDYIRVRQQINVMVGDNYHTPLDSYRCEEFDQKILQLNKIIEVFKGDEIVESLLRKIPVNLFAQLKRCGFPKEQNLVEENQLRDEEKEKPRFDYNENDSEDEGEDDQILDTESESYMSGMEDNDWDVSDRSSSSELRIKEEQCEEEIEEMDIPDFKHISSQIEHEISGNQFTQEEMKKIMQISMFQLFLLSSAEAKLKAIVKFYSDILKSKARKLFVDSLLVMIRIEEFFTEQQDSVLLNYNKMGLSPRRALDSLFNFVTLCYENDSDAFYRELADEGGSLLPTANDLLSGGLSVQDNILTLLIMYSKIKHPKTKRKVEQILRKKTNYKLKKKNGHLLTKQVFKNENDSGFWRKIQHEFNIKLEKSNQFLCCLGVYGKELKNELIQTLSILQQKIEENTLMFEVKVAENLLKMQKKKLKHFYYWNKNMLSDLSSQDKKKSKFKKILKNKEFLKLVQLMFFYLKNLKDKFFEKIEEKIFTKMIWLPKCIIQIAFLFLKNVSEGIGKWKNTEEVKKFYQTCKYGAYPFEKLEEVCNLILQFLQVPSFSLPAFKNIVIPYFMKNPERSFEVPLIFKAPNIPEDSDGQTLFVTRQCSFDMSFYQLKNNSILVEYHQEEGSDHGGMVRELMMGWQGQGIGEEHCFIGKLLGISFKKGIPYGGSVDMSMAIAITNFTPTLQFLKEVDKKLYQNLKYILENDVEDLDLFFSASKQKYGILKQYPLKINGEKLAVTNQNKEQYVQLYLQNYYRIGRQWELDELKVGFYSIVNKKYAAIFHPLQLIQKVRGEEVDDYLKLKNKAKYEQGYTEASPIIKWLWEIIASFDQKQMNKFIQFLTGAPKISLYDPHFKFIVQKTYGEEEKNRLPVAHTCFNTLDLPQYPTKEVLEKKLRQAIFEGNDNFGIL